MDACAWMHATAKRAKVKSISRGTPDLLRNEVVAPANCRLKPASRPLELEGVAINQSRGCGNQSINQSINQPVKPAGRPLELERGEGWLC